MYKKNVMEMTEQDFNGQEVPIIQVCEMRRLSHFVNRNPLDSVTLSVIEDNGADLPGDSFTFGDIELISGLKRGETVVSRDEKMERLRNDGFSQLSFRVFQSLLFCDLTPSAKWRTHTICFDAILLVDPEGNRYTPVLVWSARDQTLNLKIERVAHNIGIREKLSAVVRV